MSTNVRADLREAVVGILAEHGHAAPGPTESLFLSGKLDSMAALEVLMLLEDTYGIDLGDADFDITQIDTLQQLGDLAERGTGTCSAETMATLVAVPTMIVAKLLDPETASGRSLIFALETV